MRLTAPDGYQAERSYSIASAPRSQTAGLELVIERLDDGEVSPFFHDVAEVGDDIELRGPIGGHFVWEVADGGPLLLLGGGSGVVPLMSMIRHRASRPFARAYGAAVLRPDLRRRALSRRAARAWMPVAMVSILLSRSPVNRHRRADDYGRRVDTAMLTELLARLPEPPKQVFVCGSNPFVEAAADATIAAGVAPSLIRTERYGG